jgi:hypothetical protein
MERTDHKIISELTWERNYNAGYQTDRTDISTVELAGTHQEADLITRGLKALKGQLLLEQATASNTNGAPELDKVDKLLEDIGEAKYVGEAEVRKG